MDSESEEVVDSDSEEVIHCALHYQLASLSRGLLSTRITVN